MRIAMSTREEILRLKELGHSQREIVGILKCDRRTVRRYWNSGEQDKREKPEWVEKVDWEYVRGRRKLGIFVTNIYKELFSEYASVLPSYKTFARTLSQIEKEKKSKLIIKRPKLTLIDGRWPIFGP